MSIVNSLVFLWLYFANIPISSAQQLNRRVLFLGNSYTYVNDLPQITKEFAASLNDTLINESHTVGGYTLDQHYADTASTNKIINGGWDYVIMQEQSQLPAWIGYYSNGGRGLCSLVEEYNPCARKMFYMTWGRKNGDASNCAAWPPVCTYAGMDSLLRLRYIEMAILNNAEVSPVGAVWNYLRQNYPAIELYQPDGSHPSVAGSYAAACSFYTTIFKKDPSLSTYNFSLDPGEAAIIRNAAKAIVFDSLQSWDFSNHFPTADFAYTIGYGQNEVLITNRSVNADSLFWDFGDGFNSSADQPTHSYTNIGNYQITLTALNCDLSVYNQSSFQLDVNFCSHNPKIVPDSLLMCPGSMDTLWTQLYNSYQWLDENGDTIANETNQFLLPSPYRYYSVITSENGCAEMSPQAYVSGFNPLHIFHVDSISTSTRPDTVCNGDTIRLILSPNKPSGPDQYFQWFENGTSIASATDDTLIVTTSGSYSGRVYSTFCPGFAFYESDTFHFNFLQCTIGIPENTREEFLEVFPNPSESFVQLKIKSNMIGKSFSIFDLQGRKVLNKRFEAEQSTLWLGNFSDGIYFLKIDNSETPPFLFLKCSNHQ